MRLIAAFLFIFLFQNIFAQNFENIHSLKNVSVESFYSESVGDSFYVYTKLPDGYHDSTKTYPVLYVMDGDLLFPIAAGTLQYLNIGNYVPQLIIVGVGYGTMDWREGNQRSRDFTAVAADGRPFEGGAPVFLNFMTDELIPLIDDKYRTKKDERILMGHSLGGQFVLFSLLNSPRTFSKYLASSPFIFRIKDYYHNRLKENAPLINQTENRVFISVGENEQLEEYLITISDYVNSLKQNLNSKTSIYYKKLSEGEHFLNAPTAMVFGLKWLFEE